MPVDPPTSAADPTALAAACIQNGPESSVQDSASSLMDDFQGPS